MTPDHSISKLQVARLQSSRVLVSFTLCVKVLGAAELRDLDAWDSEEPAKIRPIKRVYDG